MNVEMPGRQLDRRQILGALKAFRRGDFSVRLPEDQDGMDARIAGTFNEIVDLNDHLAREFERLKPYLVDRWNAPLAAEPVQAHR